MFTNKVYAVLEETVEDPLEGTFDNAGDIFGFAINVIIGVGWALVFVVLALGIVQLVMSKGEKTAAESAQKMLTYAVIGGISLFFVSFIRAAIKRLLDTDADPGGDEFDIWSY